MIPYCQLSLKDASSKALVIIALLIISGIQISLSPYKSKVDRHNENSRILEDIEAIMFVDQNSRDSLVSLIDTVNITPVELARLSTIRAKIHIDNGEYAKSFSELERADSIFILYKNTYHQTLNKYIKATVLEKLMLFNTASELYLECNHFFSENHNDKFRFHTSLGILRMNNELKISTNEIIRDLENNVKNYNDPLYTGLYYATMGNIGANDSVNKLENDRLKLRSRIPIMLFVFGLVLLFFVSVLLYDRNKIKQGKLKQEILKLKNIEIEEQIGNLQRSLENREEKNEELIGLVEELEAKYIDSKAISRLMSLMDNNPITSWLEFENRFSDFRPGWVELLKEKAPDLSPTDIKYCMCFCFNLNNFEISKLLNVGESAVKSAKKRIRDKFSLNNSRDIYLFLRCLR